MTRTELNSGFDLSPVRIDAGRLSDRVIGELQRQIVFGQAGPGTRLPPEADMERLFGVSRTVIREAVRTLSARGLVDVKHGIGTVVAAPSDIQFSESVILLLMRSELTMGDVLNAREALEIELAILAARGATDKDREFLEDNLAAFAAAVSSKDWQTAHQTHLSFHLGLYAAVNLPALTILLRPMAEVIMLTSLPPRTDEESLWDVGSHPPILEALKARDEDRLREAVRAHFEYKNDEAYREFIDTPFYERPRAEGLPPSLAAWWPDEGGRASS